MRNRIVAPAALLAMMLAMLLLGSCSARKPKEPLPAAGPADAGKEIVAEVNGVPIYASDLNLAVTRFEHKLTSGDAKEPESEEQLREEALQSLIENELLFQEARRRGFTAVQEEVEEEMAAIAGQFPGQLAFEKSLAQMNVTKEDLIRDLERAQAVGKMIEASIAPGVTVSAREARAYYDANPQLFTDPERIHARHVFLRVVPGTTEEQKAGMRRTLEGLRKRALQGESFEALADQYSQDPNAGKGGDLGYLVREGLPQDFEKAVFALQTGEISGVVKSVYGYHLIQAVERQPPTKVSFERVKDSLLGFLRRQKVDETVSALAKELRDKARISIPRKRK